MPHKQIIKYNGQDIEVIAFDTEIHLLQSKVKILKEIERLIDEDKQYQKDGKLSK